MLPASRQLPLRLSETVPAQCALSPCTVCSSCVILSFPPHLVFPSLFPQWQDYRTSVLLLVCPCLSFPPDFFPLLSSSLCWGKSDEQLPCCHCWVAWHKDFSVSTSLLERQPAFSRNSPRKVWAPCDI